MFVLFLYSLLLTGQSDTLLLTDTSGLHQQAVYWEQRGNERPEADTSATGKIASLHKALDAYKKLQYQGKQSELLFQIARLYMRQSNNAAAEKSLMQLVAFQQEFHLPNIAQTYDLLTILHRSSGNLNRALFYAMETVKSAETDTNKITRALYASRLASLYLDLGDVDRSISLLKESLKTYQTEGVSDQLRIHNIASTLVKALLLKKHSDEALAIMQEVIKNYPPNTPSQWESVLLALADCYNARQQFDLAERYYLEALAWEEKEQHGFTMRFNIYYKLGHFYDKQKQYARVKPYLLEALATKGTFPLTNQQDIYRLMFRADSAAGNYLEAIHHLKMYQLLNDSLFNVTKSRQIEELQIQYETEKKERDIEFLQAEKLLQKNRLQQANVTKNLTLGGILLLLLFTGMLYSRYRMKQDSNRQLEIQQIEINQTNAMLHSALEEKEWLLREVHHRVKNNLQIVMSLLNTQSAYLDDPAALSAIRHSQHRIHSISLIHQKLYQSKNSARIDMPVYISELVDYLQDSFNTGSYIRIDLRIAPVELEVSQTVPLGLILNETISNSIKYAFPDHRQGTIRIVLEELANDQFQLIISDDGVGLPEDQEHHTRRSFGLSLIRGLCKQLGGHCTLQNQDGLTIQVIFTRILMDHPLADLSTNFELTA